MGGKVGAVKSLKTVFHFRAFEFLAWLFICLKFFGKPGARVLEPSLMVIGINFRTAPVAVRERFWVSEPRRRQALAYLSDAEGIEEAVVLSTCERTEFLIWANDAALAANSVLRLLSSEFSLQLCEWEHFYRLLGEDALVHLFRVAGGLDSVVMGDQQITPWLKNVAAKRCGDGGKCLDAILQRGLAIAEKVRREHGIAQAGVSVASVAMKAAKQMFGSLEHRTVVLIGAGMMGELAAGCVANQGVSALRILNRTFERAVQLAQKVGGTAVPFEDAVHEMAKADVVISCTASAQPILTADQGARMLRERKGQRLCIMDLGLPRNIDPGVREIPGVMLYDLDDIQRAVLHSACAGKPATLAAETFADAEAREFHRKLMGEHIIPMVVALRDRLDQICRQELQAFRRERGPFLKDQDHTLVELASRITQRVAASLVHELKEVPEKAEQEHMTDAVNRLFHLEAEKELVSNHPHAQ
jgi:glutamyl-tRNA reductase